MFKQFESNMIRLFKVKVIIGLWENDFPRKPFVCLRNQEGSFGIAVK